MPNIQGPGRHDLVQLFERGELERAAAHLHKHPALARDTLSFHAALRANAPGHVIDRFLAAYPDIVNEAGENLETALHVAVQCSHWHLVTLLLHHGADVTRLDIRRHSPLSLALRQDPLPLHSVVESLVSPKILTDETIERLQYAYGELAALRLLPNLHYQDVDNNENGMSMRRRHSTGHGNGHTDTQQLTPGRPRRGMDLPGCASCCLLQ